MPRATKNDVEKFFDYGLDMGSRTFYLGHSDEGVDAATAAQAIRALHLLDRTEGAITIKMNSIGGDCYHGLAIYDAIQGCRNEVEVTVYGCAMSMGLVILQAADRRLLAPHATAMWHLGSAGFEGHAKDFERNAAESKRLSEVMNDILLERVKARHPSYTAAKLKKAFEFDVFMTAKQTVDLGLADGILE